MGRRKKREEESSGGSWLTTYGDMVTLILTFFILLYSFSTIDVIKFKKMMFSFKEAIGVMKGGKTFEEQKAVFSGRSMESGGESKKSTQDIMQEAQKIQAVLKEEGLESDVTITVNQRGVVVSIAEGLLFRRGEYEVRPVGKKVLLILAKIIKELPNNISVEGHADSVPIRSSGVIKDNWTLSVLRAARIVAFFEKNAGISSKRLQAVGYGDSRPIMPNDTELHRSMNRRADIVFLSESSLF
ncbi:MAG: flagellar motor protein MotB [Thermovirga sp.]|nr:flagellar motor protein MotB [Thermovirga sp.]